MDWEVAYYDEGLPLRVVSSDDTNIEGLDRDGVVWVEVRAWGVRPWGSEKTEYKMRLFGADHYYLDVVSDSQIDFGLIDEEGSRRDYTWDLTDGCRRAERDGHPGVWMLGKMMPDEHAREVGIL